MRAKWTVPVLLAVLAAVGVNVSASPILDQSNLGGGTLREDIYGNRELAQTFTVGIAGTLDSVVLDLRNEGVVPTQDIKIDIRTTTGGLPGDTSQILASVMFDPSVLTSTFTLYSIDFSGFSLPVHVGDQLAIVAISADVYHTASWRSQYSNPYPGGEKYTLLTPGAAWSTNTYDRNFQTYVTPIPSPAGVYLVVTGLVSLALRRRMAAGI